VAAENWAKWQILPAQISYGWSGLSPRKAKSTLLPPGSFIAWGWLRDYISVDASGAPFHALEGNRTVRILLHADARTLPGGRNTDDWANCGRFGQPPPELPYMEVRGREDHVHISHAVHVAWHMLLPPGKALDETQIAHKIMISFTHNLQ
jgi:hypothetical protein